eukprot:763175-Rhodomonas_salina.1
MRWTDVSCSARFSRHGDPLVYITSAVLTRAKPHPGQPPLCRRAAACPAASTELRVSWDKQLQSSRCSTTARTARFRWRESLPTW